jgi:hypothetical protein
VLLPVPPPGLLPLVLLPVPAVLGTPPVLLPAVVLPEPAVA